MSSSYALSILMPSGVIFENAQRANITGFFTVGSTFYYEFADGLVVESYPSLDKKFLQFYEEKDAYFPYQYSN